MVQANIDSPSRIKKYFMLNTEDNGKDVINETQNSSFFGRGFEPVLHEQDPKVAALLTEGVCGICPVCHPLYCLLVIVLINKPLSEKDIAKETHVI